MSLNRCDLDRLASRIWADIGVSIRCQDENDCAKRPQPAAALSISYSLSGGAFSIWGSPSGRSVDLNVVVALVARKFRRTLVCQADASLRPVRFLRLRPLPLQRPTRNR